jgi:hypothetical protein
MVWMDWGAMAAGGIRPAGRHSRFYALPLVRKPHPKLELPPPPHAQHDSGVPGI